MTEKTRARCAPAVCLLTALLGASVGSGTAAAAPPGVIDSDSIIRGLSSPGTTTRGFEVEARTTPATPSASGPGTVNLDIRFANDSNQLSPAAHAQLSQLGSALNSPALSHTRFLIAGHTSATGDPGHNQQLSESRARSVRAYLLEHFSIAPARIETTGYGASHPLPQYAPTALQQRRVEISTLPPAP
jgi:outer membrane protein OmpA-like peptidoglycan-associated protein